MMKRFHDVVAGDGIFHYTRRMNSRYLSLLLLLALALGACKPREAKKHDAAGSRGAVWDEQVLERVDGQGTISLKDYIGRSLLVVFFGPWTDGSRDIGKQLIALQASGLPVLPVVVDRMVSGATGIDIPANGSILPAVKATSELLAMAGSIKALPTTSLLGPDGQFGTSWGGYVAVSNILAGVINTPPPENAAK